MHLTGHLTVHRKTSRRRRRSGYSLVELLISMAILGIVGSVLAQIMMGQQRFFQRSVEQMAVRRELRTSINLLPAELRGIASTGGDIVAFTATSLTFRSTMGVAFVCAKSSSTSIDIPPLNSSKAITSAWYSQPSAGDTLFALRNDSSGVKGEYWSAHRITAVSSATTYCPASIYSDAVNDATKLRYRFTVTPALPDSVVVSSPIRFTRTGRYALTQQASGRYYLTRADYVNGSWSSDVPVSGPYMAPGVNGLGGMSLAFYDSTGVGVASAVNASKIARVDVTLRAQGLSSSGKFGSATTSVIDSVAFRIALRNRR